MDEQKEAEKPLIYIRAHVFLTNGSHDLAGELKSLRPAHYCVCVWMCVVHLLLSRSIGRNDNDNNCFTYSYVLDSIPLNELVDSINGEQ